MAVKWTDRQLRAMENRKKLTVLSAAAGSGKTTVLVERALRLLLDEEHPVSADKFLIVTFSNASAAEFKKRIEKGINERIKQFPQNNYIKSQKVALQKADISTIHAFCIKLVRENFESLDISADFTICDEALAASLHRKAIEKAMNYGYELEDFRQLVSFYGKSSSDKDIREFLSRMNYFFSALPHPIQTAQKYARQYDRRQNMADSPTAARIMAELALSADYLTALAGRMRDIYDLGTFDGYDDGISKIQQYAARLLQAAETKQTERLKGLLSAEKITLGRAKPACDESKAINGIIHKEFYNIVSHMHELAQYLDEEKRRWDIQATAGAIRALFSVFIKYQHELMELKKSRKTFEFSDFEHFALQLLQNEDGSPTALAETLRSEYEYIMEDEFQDTSYIQDEIFSMIAKPGLSNLYVVGDVKQSIYGFRKASPQIFLEKRAVGLNNPGAGRTIFLPHNFRSEYPVIRGVNYIFTRLMSRLCGGVDYDENERLKTLKEPSRDVGVQLLVSENGCEAKNTAAAISRMIKDGYIIQTEDGPRPVQSGDFCILMRNAKQFALYKEELEKLGFEAFVKDDELILRKREVQNIINLLRVAANPLQEVYLTAAMFGDMFDFTLDEILKIKSAGKQMNLYKALAAADDEKSRYMLGVLKDISYVGGVYSADKLIDYVCKKTGYYQRIAFSNDGPQKRENIRWFIDFAKNWAKNNQSSLRDFLRWIDLYLERGRADSTAVQKNDKAIAIMTMHTSKGLEFPVCFVCGLGTKFNRVDSSRRFLLDVQLGVGMYANTRFGYNHSTLNVRAIKSRIKDNSASEEMRLLYVAFTRSKNLLVLSAEYNNTFTPNSIPKAVALTGNKPHPRQLRQAVSPIIWVLYALAHHPAIACEYSYGTEDSHIPPSIDINLHCRYDIRRQESARQARQSIDIDRQKIAAAFTFVYPHAARTRLPIKLSVSDIAKSAQLTLSKPDFIRQGRSTAAEKGTAMHRFAQHADICAARTDLDGEIAKMTARALTEERLLDKTALGKFIFSPVADMILSADKVHTEMDFLIPYNAALAMGDETYAEDEVLVQGVMDCVLEKDGRITVIDYKTDRVPDMQTLKDRYTKQLELYRLRAKRLFRTENVNCLLYSFHLNQHIIF